MMGEAVLTVHKITEPLVCCVHKNLDIVSCIFMEVQIFNLEYCVQF